MTVLSSKWHREFQPGLALSERSESKGLCDFTTSGSTEVETGVYVSPGVDGRVARIDPTKGGSDPLRTTYFFGDALQSVLQVTNASGVEIRKQFTDAWGNDIAGVGSGSSGNAGDRFGFTGRENDAESGLMHYRARSYDPMVGRFTSRDPVPYSNLYIYTHNNPVNRTDPDGRDDAYWPEFVQRLTGFRTFRFTSSPGSHLDDSLNAHSSMERSRQFLKDWAFTHLSDDYDLAIKLIHEIPNSHPETDRPLTLEEQQAEAFAKEQRAGLEAALGTVGQSLEIGLSLMPGADLAFGMKAYSEGDQFKAAAILAPLLVGMVIKGGIKFFDEEGKLVREFDTIEDMRKFAKKGGLPIEGHHTFMKALGGHPEQRLVGLLQPVHRGTETGLHAALAAFEAGRFYPRVGRTGEDIVEELGQENVIEGLRRFYSQPQWRYLLEEFEEAVKFTIERAKDAGK